MTILDYKSEGFLTQYVWQWPTQQIKYWFLRERSVTIDLHQSTKER